MSTIKKYTANPLLLIIMAASLAAVAIVAIKKGKDWRAADTAPLMYLTVDRMPSTVCKHGWPGGLAGEPAADGSCRYTGFVYKREGVCMHGKEAWGMSKQRHGKGEVVLFCEDLPVGMPASQAMGMIRSYEAVPMKDRSS